MKKTLLFLLLNLTTYSGFCQNAIKKTKPQTSKSIEPINSFTTKKDIKIKPFTIDQGWGFDIYINDKKQIHQPNIPAINGKKPFKTKKDALKIAELMKTKICKNIFPPSVSTQEIDSLIAEKQYQEK